MSALSDDLVTQVLQLPDEDRGKLADRLIASLHRESDDSTPDEIRAAWVTECRRRIAASDAGSPGIPLQDAWPEIVGRHV